MQIGLMRLLRQIGVHYGDKFRFDSARIDDINNKPYSEIGRTWRDIKTGWKNFSSGSGSVSSHKPPKGYNKVIKMFPLYGR